MSKQHSNFHASSTNAVAGDREYRIASSSVSSSPSSFQPECSGQPLASSPSLGGVHSRLDDRYSLTVSVDSPYGGASSSSHHSDLEDDDAPQSKRVYNLVSSAGGGGGGGSGRVTSNGCSRSSMGLAKDSPGTAMNRDHLLHHAAPAGRLMSATPNRKRLRCPVGSGQDAGSSTSSSATSMYSDHRQLSHDHSLPPLPSSAVTVLLPDNATCDGNVCCVFCGHAEATIVCLGEACRSFLNGKLPVLCYNCSKMLHMHHPNHRLFYCQETNNVPVDDDPQLDADMWATGSGDIPHELNPSSDPSSPQSQAHAHMDGSGSCHASRDTKRSKPSKQEMLENIHERYLLLLMYVLQNPATTLIDAYRATGLARTAQQEYRWIAELRLTDEQCYKQLLGELTVDGKLPRLTKISMACQELLQAEPLASKVTHMRATKQLLPYMSASAKAVSPR